MHARMDVCMYVCMYNEANRSHDDTLIFIMIVFVLAKKESMLIPNAENKDRTGAFWLKNLNLSFFYGEKKRQSL